MNLRTLGLIALLFTLLFMTARVLADVKAERLKLKLDNTCIEKVVDVVRDVDGVIETSWDEEAEELEIVFEQDKTNVKEIEKTISEAGFNTPNYEALEKAAEKAEKSCKEETSAGI